MVDRYSSAFSIDAILAGDYSRSPPPRAEDVKDRVSVTGGGSSNSTSGGAASRWRQLFVDVARRLVAARSPITDATRSPTTDAREESDDEMERCTTNNISTPVESNSDSHCMQRVSWTERLPRSIHGSLEADARTSPESRGHDDAKQLLPPHRVLTTSTDTIHSGQRPRREEPNVVEGHRHRQPQTSACNDVDKESVPVEADGGSDEPTWLTGFLQCGLRADSRDASLPNCSLNSSDRTDGHERDFSDRKVDSTLSFWSIARPSTGE